LLSRNEARRACVTLVAKGCWEERTSLAGRAAPYPPLSDCSWPSLPWRRSLSNRSMHPALPAADLGESAAAASQTGALRQAQQFPARLDPAATIAPG
jgi:hypothetical protein